MGKNLIFFLLLALVACGQTTNKKPSKINNQQSMSDWKTLEELKYSIQYPSNWELNQSGQMGTSFIIFSPLESEQDKFRENINLLIQDLAGQNIDIDKYTTISENQIKTVITNSTLFESKRMVNGTQVYHKLIYTGDQGIYHLKFEQYYSIVDDKAYVLTFSTEQLNFEDFKETGEKILNSFKLKR